MLETLYEVLGVAADSDIESIKAAYRRRSRETHPDAGGNAEEFKAVNEAFQVLSDERKRAQYDQYGEVDDGPKESAAFRLCASLINDALNQWDVEPLRFMRDKLKDIIRHNDRVIKDAREKQVQYQGYLDRFCDRNEKSESSDGKELIEGALRSQLALVDSKIAECEAKSQECQEALEMLAGLECMQEDDRSANDPFSYARREEYGWKRLW